MSKPKLLLIWPYYTPDPGAAAARGEAFAKYLDDSYQVTVLTKNNGKFTKYHDKRNVIRLDLAPSLNPLKFAIGLSKLVKAIRKVNPEIIIASSPNVILAFWGALAANRLRKKFYLDVRDLNFASRGLKAMLLKRINMLTYRSATKVFVTTEMQKIMTEQQFHLHPSKIILIPNGIDSEKLEHIPQKRKSVDLVFQGSINPERNIPGLVKLILLLLNKAPELKIRFIGFDSASQSAREFHEQLEELGLWDKLEIIGEQKHQETLNLTADGRIGLVSISDSEQLAYMLPVKVIEYMALGLAVAALVPSSATALHQFWHQYQPGVISNEPQQLAERILSLLKSDKLKELSHKNKKIISDYDRKTIIQKVKSALATD